MGFHRDLETDGVPAPSKFDPVHRRQTVTVETLPVENLVVAVQQAEFNFDQFMEIAGMTYHCEQWRDYCERVGIAGQDCKNPTDTLDGWWAWLGAFYEEEDEHDQRDTQADCLT